MPGHFPAWRSGPLLGVSSPPVSQPQLHSCFPCLAAQSPPQRPWGLWRAEWGTRGVMGVASGTRPSGFESWLAAPSLVSPCLTYLICKMGLMIRVAAENRVLGRIGSVSGMQLAPKKCPLFSAWVLPLLFRDTAPECPCPLHLPAPPAPSQSPPLVHPTARKLHQARARAVPSCTPHIRHVQGLWGVVFQSPLEIVTK